MEKKRKYILLACAAVAALALALRNWGGGALNVPSPGGGGSIRLSVCDGKTVTWQLVFGAEENTVRKILARADASERKDWVPPEDPWPIYGLQVSGTKEDFTAAWINGVWVDNRGRTLETDLDFPALWEQFAVDTHTREGIWSMECRRELALRNGAWDTRFLIAAPDPEPPEDVAMSFTDVALSWAIVNEGENRYSHGNGGGATLEVCVNGIWYYVPQTSGNHYGVTAEEYIMEPGGRYDSRFSMGPYGDLPRGNYRITFAVGKLDNAGREERYTCALYFLVQEDGTYAQESP